MLIYIYINIKLEIINIYYNFSNFDKFFIPGGIFPILFL